MKRYLIFLVSLIFLLGGCKGLQVKDFNPFDEPPPEVVETEPPDDVEALEQTARFGPGLVKIEEIDGSPAAWVKKVKFTNTTVAIANGEATVTIAGVSPGSGSVTTIEEGDVGVGGADIVTIDFQTGFSVVESPDTETNISLDVTPSGGSATLVVEEDAIQVKYDSTDFQESTNGLYLGDSPTVATKVVVPEIENSGNLTFDAINAAANSTIALTNSDATYVANATVEGLITVGVGIDATGAVDMDYGSNDITDHTFVTDGTGTAEIVLPAGSIDGTEILDDTIDSADYAAGSIDAEHLAADIVDETKIADDGIDSEHYNDGSIDLAHLAAGVYAKDIVTTAPVTGATDNVLVGADSDVTIALDFTAAWDFGGATSLEIPNKNADPAATGELIVDTTVTNFTNGALRFYDGTAIRHVVSMVAATAEGCTDDQVIAYDAAADLFYCKADADTGGATAYDDIGNPDAAGSISFADTYSATYTSATTATDQFVFEATGAFGNISIMKIEQKTGNATDGDLLQLLTADADVDHLLMSYGAADYVTHKIVDAGTYTIDVTSDGTAAVDVVDGLTAGSLTSDAGLAIADSGNIGSASDADSIAIDATGNVTFSQNVVVSGTGIELNHATANTLTASGGVLSIEGNVVHHTGGTDITDADIADDITITSTGTVEGAVITEGGNAVYNATETPGGELGNTWASPTIDDTGITLTSITIGAIAGLDSIDVTGAADMDYGSADVTDHTFVADGGTAIIDGSIQFPDADGSPAAAGELQYDNTVTGLDDGALVWYDDDEVQTLVALDSSETLAAGDDGKVLQFNWNAGNGYWNLASAGAGDVTGVGDCPWGPCLDGTSDGGTTISLYDGDSHKLTIDAGDHAADGTIAFISVDQSNTLTMNESLTVGGGSSGTITFSAASKTITVADNTTVNQDLQTTDAVTFATIDTGQGANELYDMDQNVLTTSSPTFVTVTATTGVAVGDGDYVGVTSNERFTFATAGTIAAIGTNLEVGAASADDTQPHFAIIGDADSDAAGDTDDTFKIDLTANATPTSALWEITSTQSAGYTFDKEVTFKNNAAAATFGAVATNADVVLAFDAVTAQGSITYMEDEDRFDFDNDVHLRSDSAVLGFGADGDVTLTHVADNALSLNLDLRLVDGQGTVFGSNQDWDVYYDETTDDALEFETAATAAAAATDPMFLILVDSGAAGMTADQDVFGIFRGTTRLFTVDEDGDVWYAGNLEAQAQNDPYLELDTTTASDTDWYIGQDADQGGDDNDPLEFRKSATANTSVMMELSAAGILTTTSNMQVGPSTPDDVQPTFAIYGDADSDAAGDTTETLTFTLAANATPTSAIWNITSTQSSGYVFDKSVTVGPASPDDVTPTFKIRGDADSDAAGDTTEALTILLNTNADPTAATWSFTSTQSAGYIFDKEITFLDDLFMTKAAAFISVGDDPADSGTILLNNGASIAFEDATEATITHVDNTGFSINLALDVVGALTAASVGSDAGITGQTVALTHTAPEVMFTDSTTSGEAKILITDGAGPDAVMDLQVDLAGTLTTYVQLDAVNAVVDITPNLNLAASSNYQIGGADIIADSAGTATLSNIDALDATTEATIEAAIDTIAGGLDVSGGTLTAGTIAGTVDAGGATSVEIPNGANPTTDTTGEIGIDTTDDQIHFYGGSAERIVSYKNRECFTVEDIAAGDDNVPIFSHEDAFTVTDMRCWTEGGTSVQITLSDGTNDLDTMTCDADGADDDGTIANSTFTADEQMEFDTGTVTGSVTWVNFCFTYTITAE